MYRYGIENIISCTFEMMLIHKIKEIHLKIIVRNTSHPLGWVLKKSTIENNKCWQECGELEFLYTVNENVNGISREKQYGSSLKN